MASISNDPGGRRRISFTDATGARRSLRLGVVPRKQADRILVHVEALITAQILGSTPADETTRWLATASDKLRSRIAKVGLIRGEVEKTIGLGAFLEGYEQTRGDVKESTATFYGHTIRNLKAFFGADKPLGDVTVADASKFRQWLASNEGLTDSTIRRRCSLARQFFAFAVDDRIIAENPFGKLKGIGVISNRDRDYFLTREDAAKVLAACPDAEWRAVFAMARYGGLRTPSETLALRWADVDWAAGKVRVTSPKTEHHAGKGSRVIPLFPELREHLEDLFDPENEFVITRLRALGKNLRTQLERIVKRAGLTPWPKLFQNLRLTRETELAEAFPIHVVCEWIGNSRAVAQKHYLQVTDDHFAAAAGRERKAAQKTAQQAAARRCKAMNTAPEFAPFSRGTSRNPANPEKNGQREWAAQDSNL